MRASFHLHAIHGERLFVSRCVFVLTFSVCFSFTLHFSSHFYLYSDLNSFFHVDIAKAIIPASPPTEESCSLAEVKCWKQERFTQDTDKFVIDNDDMDSDTTVILAQGE